MANREYEDKEFHGSVKFFGVTIIDAVGSFVGNLVITGGDITMDATKKFYIDGGVDTYIYESGSNIISFVVNGTSEIHIDSNGVRGEGTNSPIMANETASVTNPTFIPNRIDFDTGLGWVSANIWSMVAGAVSVLTGNNAGITMPLGFQSTSQQLEPTNSTAAGNTILPNTRNVEVIAPDNGTDDWILLPSLSAVPIGHTIIIACNSGGAFEMRTPSASNETINTVNSDGDTKEYLCSDREVITVTKVSASDGWIATAQTALGAIATAVVPDA